MVGAPFARLLANLVVMGTGVLGRAFLEAYKQALQSAFCRALAAAASQLSALPMVRRRWQGGRGHQEGGDEGRRSRVGGA